jgi:uncharacterized glyoxalase superfamily protein PhnB
MSAAKPIDGPRITPYLLYRDVGGALKFLSKAFGFKKLDSMKGKDGVIQHAAMQFGDGLVMLGYPGKKYRNPRKLGHVTQSLYIMVDDVDDHYKKAKKAGAKILEKPSDMFYGHRRYGASDPEGHEWYFATNLGNSSEKKPESRKKKH